MVVRRSRTRPARPGHYCLAEGLVSPGARCRGSSGCPARVSAGRRTHRRALGRGPANTTTAAAAAGQRRRPAARPPSARPRPVHTNDGSRHRYAVDEPTEPAQSRRGRPQCRARRTPGAEPGSADIAPRPVSPRTSRGWGHTASNARRTPTAAAAVRGAAAGHVWRTAARRPRADVSADASAPTRVPGASGPARRPAPAARVDRSTTVKHTTIINRSAASPSAPPHWRGGGGRDRTALARRGRVERPRAARAHTPPGQARAPPRVSAPRNSRHTKANEFPG